MDVVVQFLIWVALATGTGDKPPQTATLSSDTNDGKDRPMKPTD